MSTISCKWRAKKKCMVKLDGQVFQCWYLKEDFPVNHWRTDQKDDPVIKQYKFEDNNLNNHSLKSILNNEWFTKILPDSWKNPDTAPKACQLNCKEE